MNGLKFIGNPANEGEGISDAGIETYRKNPLHAVARETGQNSRDAADKNSNVPVVVEIQRVEINSAEIPNLAEYRKTVDACLREAEEEEDVKEISFFRQARELLSRPEIPVLKICDYNTTGLTGPCEKGNPFYALVKSSGKSIKEGVTSGGSFGIGKSAVYSASDLQTVFYSTVYLDDDGERRYLCQGKSKFRSFSMDGEPYRSVGYWGDEDGFMPVDNADEVPDWLQREEVGTNVYSVGVRNSEDWKHEMLASIVTNFYCAIHYRNLEFIVDGSTISADTLLSHFENSRVRDAALNSDDFDFSRHVYECVRDEDAIVKKIELENVGDFKVTILLRDGLPSRISINRNGMAICDSMKHFGDAFRRFPMFKEFIALVEPACRSANEWMKKLENPSHDELSEQGIIDESERRAAKISGKLLAKEIRNAIASEARSVSDSATEIEELGALFGAENTNSDDDEGERRPNTFKIQKPLKKKKIKKRKVSRNDDDGDRGGGSDQNPDQDPNPNPNPNPNPGSNPGPSDGPEGDSTKWVSATLDNFRTTVYDTKDYSKRRIWFTPQESGKVELSFKCSGLSISAPMSIVGGNPEVTCSKGVRQTLDVVFASAYSGPIEIDGFINKGGEE
jgi:hypothetical protein